ncbi:hypothetical protein BH10PLA1_BH10PLA1_02470 [soil metagenome]
MSKIISLAILLLTATIALADVKVVRVPDGGIEPQAAVDAQGVIHLPYFNGEDNRGDIFYVSSANAGDSFSTPVRVNSQAGSAMVVGSVRGPQMALGRDGRVHVAWMGSGVATPKAPGNGVPMLYAGSNDDGTFTEQKNVIAKQPGLDGGGSIAVDDEGHVYIAWHAPLKKGDEEQGRQVWIAKSADDGKTFAPEFSARSGLAIGACGCCSLRIAVGQNGAVAGLFRQADQKVNRGTNFFITDAAVTRAARVRVIAPMRSGICVMSNYSLISIPKAWLTAYETAGEVFFQILSQSGETTLAISSVGKGKYPAMALSSNRRVLIARAVGTGWKKGGSVAWQQFDLAGVPIPGTAGDAPDLQAWNYPAVVTLADGSFVVMY